jgi:hypothetical protein
MVKPGDDFFLKSQFYMLEEPDSEGNRVGDMHQTCKFLKGPGRPKEKTLLEVGNPDDEISSRNMGRSF